MPLTVNRCIKRALRSIGVLQTGESPEPDEAKDALEVLNAMLAKWESQGMRLNHTPLLKSSTLPFPDDHDEAIVYNLALRYATEYGRGSKVPAVVVSGAESGFTLLHNLYAEPADSNIDDALQVGFNTNQESLVR